MFTNEGKEYYDTYEQLAEHSGLSRSTVRTCLRRLEELRLVEIDKVVKSKNKLFNKNIWKVNSVFPASNVIYTKKVEHTVSKQSPKDFSSFDLDTINSELSVASVDQNLTYY
jgi:DNA-binding transcriptional regulator GbsR (MarR family)